MWTPNWGGLVSGAEVDGFRWLAGARGKAVVRVVAADQAGNVKLERGVCGAFLGFRRDSRFFGSSIAFLR
ncbi:hypothetical protein Taro_038239 [Colocasia esculenta]|uniref:Uncharacterized protein n=1 Tax=Colocasia esculenta TaxID=4460 RepID=A0A843W7P0_COLES|nr:hypothetical protein [Colocasia esculenta]